MQKHNPLNVRSTYGKRLYGHLFDMVDTAFLLKNNYPLLIPSATFPGKRKWLACVFLLCGAESKVVFNDKCEFKNI